jgi:hypothetical protein
MKHHHPSFRLALCALAAGCTLFAPPASAVDYVAFFGPVTVDTRRPDLTVATLDTPLYAPAASTQPVAWAILNQGAAPTPGGWVDRVYLATNAAGTNGRLVGEFPASGPLGTNQSLPRFQNLPIPADLVPDRDYWWVVATDAANAVDESNEINNTRASDQPMRLLRIPAPNLRVASVSASASPRSGQPVTIFWAVTNAGTWSTGAGLWQDAVYLSTTTTLDGTALPLGRATRPRPLGTNESYTSSLTATLPQGLSGPRYFIVQTDADNRVNEGPFEGDNTTASAPVAITLTPPPDLQVAAIQAPTNGLSGTSLAVSWAVTNAGLGVTDGADWTDDLYLSATNTLGTNAVLLGSFPHAGALTNGQAYHSSASIPLPSSLSGTFYLLIYTDARNAVFEHGFESNNVTASPLPILITLTPPPDLAVAQVTAPATALASHAVTVSYAVTNRGTDTFLTYLWEDRLYLTTSPAAGARTFLSAQWRLGGLGAGGTYSNSFNVTLPDDIAGPWYVMVETDATGEVFELVKTNNLRACAAPILVESRPADLVVTALSAPSSAQAGGSLLASWTVRNQGPGDTSATRWTDRLVLSADATPGNADDVTLLTREHNGLLDAGASYTVNNEVVTVPFSVAPGSYRLFLLTDSGNTVYEAANEANNASAPRSLAVTRTTADLLVAAVEVRERTGMSALQVRSEDPLFVSWRVENTGPAAPNSTVWSDAIYLSTNSIVDTNAVLLGVSQNPVSLAPGSFYTNTLAVSLPAEIQGTYFVHVVADAATEVTEDNRANNTLAATNTLQITLRPVPDLAVLSVTTPSDGFSGQPMDLSWTVTNRGPATAEGTWYDSVYLSLDPQFEPDLDTYIGYAERPTTLTNGQSYTQTARLDIPAEVSGLFYVFVRSDSTDRVNERGATNNNVGRAATPVSVWLRPPSDLVVGTVTIPTNAVAGYEMALTYILRNQGTNAAFGPWVDALYLSADDQWDIGDTLFTRVSQAGFLAAGGSRTNTVSAPAPGVLPGNYHVIIRTDVVNQVPETNEFNNITATLDRVAGQVEELVFGMPRAGAISPGRSVYYRFNATNEQTIRLAFATQAPGSVDQLFVSFERIPTRGEFDFTTSEPFVSATELVLGIEQTGTYYLLVYGGSGAGPFTMQAELLPLAITRAAPTVAGNAGLVTLKVEGALFKQGMVFALTNASGTSLPATEVRVQDSATAYVTFNCAGVEPARYSLAAQVPIAGFLIKTSLTNALNLQVGQGPRVEVDFDGDLQLRAGSIIPLRVRYQNVGDADTMAPLILVDSPAGWPLGFSPGTLTNRPIQLLGLSGDGPLDILRVGSGGIVPLCLQPAPGATATGIRARAILADDRTVLTAADWQQIEGCVRPFWLSDSEWQPFWANLRPRVGSTFGDYVRFLNRVAVLVSATGLQSYDVRAMVAALYGMDPHFRAASTLSGTLRNAATGTPFASRDIGAYRLVNGRYVLGGFAVSDDTGAFSIPYLLPGEYEMALLSDGFDMDRNGQVDPQPPRFAVTENADLVNQTLYIKLIAEESGSQNESDPVLARDADGVPHIIWSRGERVWHAWHDGMQWQGARAISTNAGSNLSLRSATNLVDGRTLGLVAAWEEGAGNDAEIVYAVARRRATNGFEWSRPVSLTRDQVRDAVPNVFITDDGRVLLTYLKRDADIRDDTDVYFALVGVASSNLVWSGALGSLGRSGKDNAVHFGYIKEWGPYRAFGTSFKSSVDVGVDGEDKGCAFTAGGSAKGGMSFRLPGFGGFDFEGSGMLNANWQANRKRCEWEFKGAQLDASVSGTFVWRDGLVQALNGMGPGGIAAGAGIRTTVGLIHRFTPLRVENGIKFSVGVDWNDCRWTTLPPVLGWVPPDYVGEMDLTAGMGPYLKLTQKSVEDVELNLSGQVKAKIGISPTVKIKELAGEISLDAQCHWFSFSETWEWTWWEARSGGHSTKDGGLEMAFNPGAALGTSNRYAGNSLLADVATDLLRDGAPVLARSADGRIFAVWARDTDPFGPQMGSQLLMAEFDGTAWSVPTAVPGTLGLNSDLDVIADRNGNRLVVWGRANSSAITTNITFDVLQAVRDTNDLFYATYQSGVWSAPARLVSTPGRDGDVDLATTPEGNVQVTWTYRDSGSLSHLLAATWNGSAWSVPVEISSGEVGNVRAELVGGQMTVFWTQGTNSSPDVTDTSLYSSRLAAGSWTQPQRFAPVAEPTGNLVPANRSVAKDGFSLLPPVAKECCDCKTTKAVTRGSGNCVVGTEFDEETCTKITTYKPCVLRSMDPNDIVGPAGFGPNQWVSGEETLRYTVRFENDPKKADLPAQSVRISQRLDPNLDFRTFRLGGVGFGATLVTIPENRAFYQVQINVTNELGVLVDLVAGLDLASGEVYWEFTSIDPATGDLPWDIFAGFLPPNTNGVIGQGFVTYTIKPKADIASGDIINAEARIYFDYNEPMDTPRIFNTVDGNLPTSTVLPLPLTTNRNIFPVRWAGSDAYGGAGISSYTLYVSDNSSPWQVWLANTPQMESLFVGECGHTYQFYSVSRDHVGNVEAATAVPQAAILLLPNQAPVLEPITNRLMAVGQALTITNRAADADVGQQLTFSLAPGAPAGMTVNPTNGVLTWTPVCVQGGSSNVITVLATDDGCGSLSSAQSFAVFVTECLQTGLGNTVGAAGGGGCVPVSLESSFGLTNFIFTVSVPPGRFTNFTVNALAPEVGSATVVSLGTTQAVVTLVPQPGQLLRGPKQFAEVCFSLLPNQTSAFVRMEVKDILGLRENGTPIGNTSGQPGRTVVVSEHPLLECVHGTSGQPNLLLYARPGWTCAIEERASVQPGVVWSETARLTVTNLVSPLPLAGTNSTGYYRAVRWVSP